jgi:rod shape determining protein RodA
MLSLFLPAGIIIAAGLLSLSAISTHFFLLQLLWVGLGVGIVLFFVFFDWHFILNYRWLIGGLYALSILLLAFVYFRGPAIRNIRSWLVLGPFNFQPVELAKISLILIYAAYFSRRHLSIARWRHILTSFILFAIPAALTALEPELGSVLVLFGVWFGFLLLSGLPPRRALAALLVFILAGVLVWGYVLKDYHRQRIVGFFYPTHDSLGINYSGAQSKIAIGSAGFWGRGYGQGTQTQLGFLTEPASDFIFAAFIEEWGVFGGIVLIGTFLFLIFQILKIGARALINFEKFVCLGVVIIFSAQFLLNSGSATGLLPVIGIPFPFLSYGGSNMLANFFLLSIVDAIRRKK